MKTDLTEENQSVVMGTAMSPAELQQGIPTSSAFQLLGNGSFLLRCPSWRGTRGFCILDQSPDKGLPGMVLHISWAEVSTQPEAIVDQR